MAQELSARITSHQGCWLCHPDDNIEHDYSEDETKSLIKTIDLEVLDTNLNFLKVMHAPNTNTLILETS